MSGAGGSRIAPVLRRLAGAGRKALIPYVAAGDPDRATTVPVLRAMVAAGADIVELGMPFSDPMADGPVIQRASERALAGGMTLAAVLDVVAEFRRADGETPVVLMGYVNPIEAMGYRPFAARAAAAGVDGVIVVDLPPEEAGPLLAELEANRIDPIFLVAPNTDEARVRLILRHARGYLYYVSLKGVTGSRRLDALEVARKVRQIKTLTELPVGVGFGIADAPSARRIAEVADAVLVGTALVRRVEAWAGEPQRIPGEVAGLVAEMRAAMDGPAGAAGR